MTTPKQPSGRVLVTYASRFGTTGEVSETIAATMSQRGMSTDTKRISDVTDVGDYDAIVIGAAINYDNWMSQARKFVGENEEILAAIPVAYFFTCGALFHQSAPARAKAQQYADRLCHLSERVTPLSIGQFAGALDYSRMNLPTRLALRTPFTLMGVSEGDRRDWDTIRTWAQALPLETMTSRLRRVG